MDMKDVTARKGRVLVVEDNPMSKTLVKEMLLLSGYEVLEAGKGTEALRLASTEAPDMVLMDLNLPEMDGVTAVRLMRAREETRGIPVVALTASALKGEEEKLLNQGFDGYIEKPIDKKRLIEAVERGLRHRRKRPESPF